MPASKTYETGVRDNGDLSYNIQVRQISDGVWQQRHIWHRDQLGEHNPPRIDPWIASFRHSDKDLAHMTPVFVAEAA